MALAKFLEHVTCYKFYVLILCVMTYLLNQLDRYLLPILSLHMAQEIHYGEKACLNGPIFNKSALDPKFCSDVKNETSCITKLSSNVTMCTWDYNGQGLEYQIIAGPVFIVIYTLCGVFIGYLTTYFRRSYLLAAFLLIWSAFTALSGLSKEYWHVAVTRFGLGIGEAGCTPFAAAIIADMFPADVRASAMGIYNFGIYVGYSMSYALGNFLYDANIMGQGWRWVFYISAMPGLPVALLVLFTIKEDKFRNKNGSSGEEEPLISRPEEPSQTFGEQLEMLFFTFLSPPLLMLCLAGSIRNSGGYSWGVNTQNFYESLNQTPTEIGTYMSWIPLVGGSLGAFFGGFISDRFVKSRGIVARMLVLVISQICAAPFALLALLLEPPVSYIMLLPSNIIGEMWIGVCLTCVLELVPEKIRAVSVAYYLFIITNIGGNIPLLLPVLKSLFPSNGLRNALIILYPGAYILSAILFILTIIVYKQWSKYQARKAAREAIFDRYQLDTDNP